MEHNIPEYGMADFEKQMGKLTRKAIKLGLDSVGFNVLSEQDVELTTEKGMKVVVKYFTIEVFGVSPKLSGWSFVAKIEHGENGNVVFSMSNDTNISEYRTASNCCDHCGISRFRNNTYVIKNDAGEYKQVGSSCLVDFMGHKDAEKIAEFFSGEWFSPSNTDDDVDDGFLMAGASSGKISFPTKHYVAWVVRAITENGWVSSANGDEFHTPTKYVASSMMFDTYGFYAPLTEQEVENAQTIIEKSIFVLENKSNLSDYEWNLLTLINRNNIRFNHIGFVSSVVGFYNRSMGIEVENKKQTVKLESNHLGVIGEKISGVEVSVVYTNAFDTDWGVSYLYKFMDVSGNKITWFASKNQYLEVGDTTTILSATVKKHDAYNDEKQTVVTRAKLSD